MHVFFSARSGQIANVGAYATTFSRRVRNDPSARRSRTLPPPHENAPTL